MNLPKLLPLNITRHRNYRKDKYRTEVVRPSYSVNPHHVHRSYFCAAANIFYFYVVDHMTAIK